MGATKTMMKKKKKKTKIYRDIAEASSNGSSTERMHSLPELMANLPTEVVIDILLRLPVKPLLRFRCVSKPWLALIDSPSFIKLHLNQSIKARNNRSLIVRHCAATYSINLDSLDVAVEIDLPSVVFHRAWYTPQLVGSCNGLMLLSYGRRNISDATKAVIWNPFTRKYLKLSNTCIESPHYRYLETYGIGYDPIHDDYKVVKMNQQCSEDDIGFYLEVKVYSLKSNTWRRIPNFPCYVVREGYGLFCGGALHWLVYDKYCESRFVAAFDLAIEKYQLVPTPNLVASEVYPYNQINLVVLEGRLCMCNHGKESIDVWVMKDYAVGESWTKLFSVSLPIDNMACELFTPLAFSKDDTKILYVHNGDGLFLFDLQRCLGKRIDAHGLPRRFGVDFVMQSLVPLGTGSKGIKAKKRFGRKDSGCHIKGGGSVVQRSRASS